MQLLNVVYATTSAATSSSHCRYPLEVERSAFLKHFKLSPLLSSVCTNKGGADSG